MGWWIKTRNGWTRVAKRLRLKKSGHVKLRNYVRTCEYEDVHILWDLLNKNQSEVTKRRCLNVVELARRARLLCHHGF